MAGLVEPAGVLLDEGLVAEFSPWSDARRIASEATVKSRRAVIGGAFAREAHGHVRVAFSGREAVAHSRDQDIADFDVGLSDLQATYLDRNLGATWIWNNKARRLVA